jgi:hypothetical protein
MHHFVQALCHNGEYGFTRNTLQAFLIKIRDSRRSPHHAQAPLLFTYHAVIDVLRLANITRYCAATGPSMALHQPLAAAAQMRPVRSPHIQGQQVR